ncbi:MAG: GNAT family N-acetyltransferase, partial [bacterium]
MEYRLARPEDRARVIEFIDAVFSMSYRPHDFRALLPKVYGDGAAEIPHHIAVNGQGDIRGTVALLPELWRVLDADLWLGYVGSVSVHPRSQGEGHMKALMALALDAAINDGLDLLVLDGQRQRYGHYGFTPGGWKLTFQVNEKNLKDADDSGYAFLPMDRAEDCDIDFARALYFDQP